MYSTKRGVVKRRNPRLKQLRVNRPAKKKFWSPLRSVFLILGWISLTILSARLAWATDIDWEGEQQWKPDLENRVPANFGPTTELPENCIYLCGHGNWSSKNGFVDLDSMGVNSITRFTTLGGSIPSELASQVIKGESVEGYASNTVRSGLFPRYKLYPVSENLPSGLVDLGGIRIYTTDKARGITIDKIVTDILKQDPSLRGNLNLAALNCLENTDATKRGVLGPVFENGFSVDQDDPLFARRYFYTPNSQDRSLYVPGELLSRGMSGDLRVPAVVALPGEGPLLSGFGVTPLGVLPATLPYDIPGMERHNNHENEYAACRKMGNCLQDHPQP